MGLPEGNDAQAGILGREECSTEGTACKKKARGQRAMCMWVTCRYTIMYLGFRTEREPRDRERGHAEGGGIEEQHGSGRALGPICEFGLDPRG